MIIEEDFMIGNQSGLHARPVATFVKAANTFKAKIKVCHGGREADAKSILSVLSLGAGKGATIRVAAEGDDAELAIETLKELVLSGFGEGLS